MKAIVFSELGGPEVLSLAEVPKPYIGKTFPLAQAPDAHRYIQSRQSTGKLIITP